MGMTEQQTQLVIEAQKGDIKSFEELFAIYHEKVYALARMITKNANDAEDVLQEAFITAWGKLNTLKAPSAFSVWIQIIAKNVCKARLRKKNMAILLDAEQDIENFDAEESEESLPAVYAERADLQERLGRIIDGLSDVQRQAIALYYFNELSVDEISDVMECSVNTVKTRLFLARKAIRSEIEEQERKSGEKFYGVAGIPLLPFGKLMQSHAQSLSIGQSAANASLRTIMDSISDAVPYAAETQKMEGMTMFKKLSLKAKIIAGASAVAAVGAVVVLAVILTTGSHPRSEPNAQLEPTPLITAKPVLTAEPTETLYPPAEPAASVAPPATPSPTPASTAAPAQEKEISYAYITNWGMRMDGQTDLAFDYVDWLTGKKALEKYMQDHPGISQEDAQNDVEEYGYVRNVNPQLRWFTTTEKTVYYMPDEIMSAKPIKVNYDSFRNKMIPAIENNETWITFVKVIVSGDSIVKIEWTYLP